MKALQCEMCGSQDMVKQDGYFVCQYCGTKYSVEEAKKMMVEGTVKVDNSDELKNLYQLARSAKEHDNRQNAAKYYDMVLAKDALNWEPNFYSAYYKFMLDEHPDANGFRASVVTVFDLISNNSVEEKVEIIKEISEKVDYVCKFRRDDLSLSAEIGKPYTGNVFGWIVEASAVEIHWGNIYKSIIEYFSDDIPNLNCFIIEHIKFLLSSVDVELVTSRGKDMVLVDYIKKFEPDYTLHIKTTSNSVSSESGGCYVATAVYGSYDCPEVWTLRRFRDFTLAKSFFGRLFIRTYYAISPTLVKWFGETKWFKNLWKPTLDKMVARLNEKGVENTPYDDIVW
ncbi:MAG: TFIIB-type zinc finger domain-containing protein [Oscillospiraceae bacterium]|nr:TFIIB-type zinc finger domain-containing protein [Oscillospiraceae bacterium]